MPSAQDERALNPSETDRTYAVGEGFPVAQVENLSGSHADQRAPENLRRRIFPT
jgi:hypothetical protein